MKTQRNSSALSLTSVLYPREGPGTHSTGGWVGPRTDLGGCGKSRLEGN